MFNALVSEMALVISVELFKMKLLAFVCNTNTYSPYQFVTMP